MVSVDVKHHVYLLAYFKQNKKVLSSCIGLKPVLNWANVSSRTYLEVFGEPSWFLIGPTFLREPSWKYSSKLYSESKKLRSTCSGNIRPIRRSLPLTG